jgi:hypothetical protein
MLGDQGDIRAIRVICGENGLEGLATKTREIKNRKLSSEPLIYANLEPRSACGFH